MSGFEYSPFGIVPLGTPSLHNATPESAARYVITTNGDPATEVVSQVPPAAITGVPRVQPATSPRSVIASARARVKQIKAELKRMRALQNELSELERLLRAAKQKPTVRPLRSVG